MVPHPSCRIPDTGELYSTVHTGRTGRTWWADALANCMMKPMMLYCSLNLCALIGWQEQAHAAHVLERQQEGVGNGSKFHGLVP